MGFSKKVATQSTGTAVSSDAWGVWNEIVWNTLDVTPTVNAAGKEVKEADVIGVLNFIMELGNLPQDNASMKSDLPVPAEGVENSPEELDKMEKYPSNYFEWVTEYDNGKKKTVRKVFWPLNPQQALVLAVDFPSLALDYGQHPANEDGAASDVKPMRIDYNGKFKDNFERNVINSVNWKTGEFSAGDIKYKITTACGNTAEYKADHSKYEDKGLANLVQATCNWTVVMTKNEKDGNVYYNTKIKNPSAIQDIKTRKDNYTVSQQLEDNKCDVPFCGILFDDPVESYEKADLQQIRTFWLQEAQKAVWFDKNAGTSREGEWHEEGSMNYADSGLCKAIKKFGLDSTDKSPTPSGVKKVETKVVEPKKIDTSSEEPTVEEDKFFDDVPF